MDGRADRPGDRIAFYVTGVQAFGGMVRVTGEMYEDRKEIWPRKPGKVDPYPWRFETEPEIILEERISSPRSSSSASWTTSPSSPAEQASGLPGPARTVSGRRR